MLLLAVLGALALGAVAATLRLVVTDGHRRVPTR